MDDKPKIALVVSHPIQHFCPQYVSFAANQEVIFKVFFASTLGYRKYVDPNFKKEISWSNLHLDQFDHEFLNGESLLQSDKNLDASGLDQALSDFKPDLVITYGYFQKLQRRAYRWATRNKVPLAYISDSELRHLRNNLFELIKCLFIRRYFSRISFFLSVGDANEEFYEKYGVKKRQVIRMHFPIDINQYVCGFDQREILSKKIRLQYGIGENEIVISIVGKLAPWKNQNHAIEAMKLLEAESIYMHLFVVGSGEMKDDLKEKADSLINSKVHFTGFVGTDELPAYYAASDFYVHTAAVEPHSIAISEAIYMGCPIIISDKCGSYGPTDDVQEGKNGYVFEFGNIGQLAQKIKLLANDSHIRNAFGLYSHEVAVEFQHQAHKEVLNELRKRIANI